MDTPNREMMREKRPWHTPEAYVLRGAQAESGARVPGARETTKNRSDFSESDLYNITNNPVMPT